MMGTELCSARVLTPPFRKESGDEELSVLPRHTKVIVTGNSRTKSVLVGLQGIVKKAVGFGGWHWLVLKNGVEVKLQRNALSVLEPPTGNEEEDEYYFSDSSSDSADGDKHDNGFSSGAEFSRLHIPRVRYAQPWFQAVPPKSAQRSSSDEPLLNHHAPQQMKTINISLKEKMIMENLGTDSLWRYCQSYKLVSNCPKHAKEQLVQIVQQHFSSQQVDEVNVVVDFVRAAKKLRTVDAH